MKVYCIILFSIVLYESARLLLARDDHFELQCSNDTLYYRKQSRQMKVDKWLQTQLSIQSFSSPNASFIVFSPNSSGGLGNTIRGYLTTVLSAMIAQIPYKRRSYVSW